MQRVVGVSFVGPDVNTTGTNICPGSCATLTAIGSGGIPPYTFVWTPGSMSGLGPHTICPPLTESYTVTITDSIGDTYSDTAVITVYAPPVIITSATNVCPGETAILSSSGAQTYTWTNGTISVFGTPISVAPKVTSTYTVTGTSFQGCTANETALVMVYSMPTITSQNIAICIDSTGTLNSSGGGGNNYTWTTPNPPGGTLVGSTLSVSHNTMGVYTYTVVGASTSNCTNSAIVNVNVNDCSKPSVILSDEVICYGNCFAMNALVTGPKPLFYSWTPDIGSGPGPILICPTTSTSYTLIVSDLNGVSDTALANITVNLLPNITASNAIICAATSTSLSATGGDGSSYTWVPSTGGLNLIGENIIVTPVLSTTYSVIGQDANGCVNSTTTSIIVNSLPVISTISDTICEGNSGMISANGGVTYTWMTTTTGPVFTAAPSVTTTYTVVATDNNQCVNSASAIIEVQAFPKIECSSHSICEGDSATITASGAMFYTWQAQNFNGPSFTDSPIVTTTYTVIGVTSAGCADTATSVVSVNPRPIVSFASDSSGCAPFAVQFINNTVGPLGATCIWDYGDNTPLDSSNCQPSHNYNIEGDYTVSLTVRTSAGCVSSLTIPDMIKVFPFPSAGFTANPLVTEILRPKITFTSNSSSDSIRRWKFGDGKMDTTSLNTIVEHLYTDTGRFIVCLEVFNEFGCMDSICQTIIITPVYSFYIPNAFTPNEDGWNDSFNGKGDNIKEYEMYIYDRWGQIIFESKSLSENWDGRPIGGGHPSQNVYVYVVKLTDVFNNVHKYIGSVTLVK